jgi:site-specific recombinase XerD
MQVAAASADATRCFVEFFTATIRNRNTRAAYARAVSQFFRWCEVRGLRELGRLEPVHVAAYVEQLGRSHGRRASSSIWQRSGCCSTWLVVGQVVAATPLPWCAGPGTSSTAAARRSSRLREAHQLIESIPTDSLVGLRDRALIGILIS